MDEVEYGLAVVELEGDEDVGEILSLTGVFLEDAGDFVGEFGALGHLLFDQFAITFITGLTL